ncbi:hypothetical protein [Burkholderia pseudomallei]|uniref:hypothetical protein n=1 Tax=Burkholderia pseudomallei TaxID=28450 RepID=UPI000A1CC436|nr:hypothetical protein [Burkholderia pseudomallei]
MKKWRIENTISGVVLGEYEGETGAQALDACARDAGYADYADLLSRTPAPEDGEILVTEIG